MSDLTLANLLTECEDATGRKDKGTSFTRAVNSAVIELIFKVRMSEFHNTKAFSTAANTIGYALDANEFAIISVRDLTNNLPLTPKEILQLDDISADHTVGAGDPSKWTLWKSDILLFEEIPDGVLSMQRRGLKRPTKLVDPDDVLATPDEWDDVVTTLAISKAFVAIGRMEEATAARGIVDSIVAGRATPEDIKKEHTVDQGFVFSDWSQK